MSVIYLVRHGITPANKENRFAGRTEEPLHKDGIAQIRKLALSLTDHAISRIISSPIRRTKQTADILAATLQTVVTIDNGLTEMFIPHWDGLTKDEIRNQFGPQYPTWLEKPHEFSLPGCETLAAVQKRAVRSAEKLFKELNSENILVVSHLIVLRCLFLYYSNKPLCDFRSIAFPNGKVFSIIRNENRKTEINEIL